MGRTTLNADGLKKKRAEAWQAGLLFFFISLVCLLVIVFSVKLSVWKFLGYILAFLVVFIIATVLAIKWDTLRYLTAIGVLYSGLLLLPLIATLQTSVFVGLGLNRFGLGGVKDVTVYLDRDRPDARAITGTLILLSPDNIYLAEAITGRLLIVRRSDFGLISYPVGAKRGHSSEPTEATAPVNNPNDKGRAFRWSDLWSPVDMFYATLSTLLGTLLGVGLTLLFGRLIEGRRARRTVQAIIRSMEFSLARMVQARDLLQKGESPNFPLDAHRMADWLSAADCVLPLELWRELDWHRFQLEHITDKLVVYNLEFVRRQSEVPIPSPSFYEDALRLSLIEHCRIIIDGTQPLLEKIAKLPK